jgi:hypothetical protein
VFLPLSVFLSLILIQFSPPVNRSAKFVEFLFDYLLTRTSVRFIIPIEQMFLEAFPMTTFGFIVMLLGAGAFSAGVIRLADWIDQPRPRRRTA